MSTFTHMIIHTLSHLPSDRGCNKAYFKGQLGPCKANGSRETPKVSPTLQMF